MSLSLAENIARLPKEEQEKWVKGLTEGQIQDLRRKPWWYIGRPEQQSPEGNWSTWLILAGRGWGKTRTCAEWLVHEVITQPYAPDGTPTEWAIIAETFSDTRTVCVEGPSGLMNVLERHGLKKDVDYFYNRSAWQIRLKTGQRIHMLGADNPDAGRGFNLAGIWADEVAKWRYPYETWTEGIAPALRIGKNPRAVIATTPKPTKLLKEWTERTDGSVALTRGSTFDNAANLSPAALVELRARYEGTRIGQQELYGELLLDIEGALWTQANINEFRITELPKDLQRIVVAVDPAATNNEDSDETGIVVAGKDNQNNGYVIADYTIKASPLEWAKRAVDAYYEHEADAIVVEVNHGGDMIPTLIRQVDQNVKIKQVRASRGKKVRAEPIAAFYEQGRVHHVGVFEKLETQMTLWTADDPKSPDRIDALVWALSDLIEGSRLAGYLSNLAVWCDNCNLPMPKTLKACSKCGASLTESDEAQHPLGV
jgi:phage terminase large subunit-like protein